MTQTTKQNITDKRTSNTTASKEDNRPRRTRYASIVTLPREETENQDIDVNTSPPVRKIIEKVLKETLSVKEIGGPTKVIIALKTGSILIESYSHQQKKKSGNILSKDKRITYKDIRNSDPVLQLSGIKKVYNDKKLLAELYKQNACFHEIMLETVWTESVKIFTKRDYRNKNTASGGDFGTKQCV